MPNYYAAKYYFAHHLIYVKLTLTIIFLTLNSALLLRRLRTKESSLTLGRHSEKNGYIGG